MEDVKESAGIGKGTPGPGRPKGVPNKATRAAKEAIAYAFEELGGADALVAWVQDDPKNKAVFYAQIYPKLLPLTVGGEGAAGEILFGWMSPVAS